MLRAAFIAILAFGFVLTALPGSAAVTHKKKQVRHTAKSSAAKAKHRRSAGARKSASSHKSTRKRATSTRKGKRRRAAATPRPAVQRAPTPQRYKEIQEALIAKGYLKGPASGVWDSDSIEAMKRFQTDQKLDPDGKIEALTLIALGLGPKNSPISNHAQTSTKQTP